MFIEKLRALLDPAPKDASETDSASTLPRESTERLMEDGVNQCLHQAKRLLIIRATV